ncbi:MAG: SDR family NAD(P)-dependent oxidoreductase [Bryobacterales bacterium]|nr:SDR family NAD(P)-dependent oxidoreductase [Bryobacterales bacterium]MDE0261390.1 SDR family NAD(P)-dependent oxidoreductase [Bryobacterales bacterium]MDE0622338.1 SDR family NAD(P)-dependent oxidoreductase [Bryobacterales bacterium]
MAHKAPFRLDGRTALVTGGGSGIGEQTVRALAGSGARVLVADLNAEAAQAVADDVANAEPLLLDVTDPVGVQSALEQVRSLDILVNNAGIGHVGMLEECTLDDFRSVMRVNVEGMFIVTAAALPLLMRSDRPCIVNIGSVAGLVGVKRRFAYCASKGAVVSMTRSLAADYAGKIRVNCVCPGTVDTPFVEAYLEKYHKHEKAETRKQLNARQPIGRLGKPDEIAHLVLYLCSDEAEFVHGSMMAIDGGWTAL